MSTVSTPRLARISSLAAAVALVACSGGSESPAKPTPAPPAEPAAFTLTLSTDKAVLLQGNTLALKASITRQPGFNDAVQVSLSGLPDGVSAAAVVIPAGATEADVLLQALGAAPHSLPTGATARGQAGAATATKAFTVTVRGAAGVADTSFAGGPVVTPVDTGEDMANAVAVQADGKLLVAGASAGAAGTRVSLVRYQRDGSIDTTFGTGGKVMTAVGTQRNDSAAAITLQPDGKILVAGSTDLGNGNIDFAVLRYNSDGTLDAGFGNGGMQTVDFAGGADRAWALLLQNDGRIVVAGEAGFGSATTGIDFALVRLTAAGVLDTTFGNGGKVSTPIKSGSGTEMVRALAIQPVGGQDHILAVGGEGDFVAARYTLTGVLDAGFGNGGKIAGLFGDVIGSARAVTVLPGGQAVLAGHIGHQFAMAQLTNAGQLDNAFGTAASGRFRFNVVDNWNEATSLVRQADGHFVVGGWAYSGAGSSGDFAAIRVTPQGLLDGTFGVAGVVIAPMAAGTKNDQSHALVLQRDDRVPTVRAIQAGEANGSNHDFAVLRLWL